MRLLLFISIFFHFSTSSQPATWSTDIFDGDQYSYYGLVTGSVRNQIKYQIKYENLNFCSNTGHRFYSSNHFCHRVVDYENRGTIIKYYLDEKKSTIRFIREGYLKKQKRRVIENKLNTYSSS